MPHLTVFVNMFTSKGYHVFLFELCKSLFEWQDYQWGGFEYFCDAHNKNCPFLANKYSRQTFWS